LDSYLRIFLAFEKNTVSLETVELMTVLANLEQIYELEKREKSKFLGLIARTHFPFKVVNSINNHNTYVDHFNNKAVID
jgi:hypothetical protein